MIKSGLDLLHVMDALVKRDRGPSGIVGRLALGVRTDAGDTWWTVKLDPIAEARFADARPEDADVTLLVGETEANTMLDTGALPPGPRTVELKGDARLLDRFMARYIRKKDMVGLRRGQ